MTGLGAADQQAWAKLDVDWSSVRSARWTMPWFSTARAAIDFVFVVPMNAYRKRTDQGVVDATPADVKLLMEIRDLLKGQQPPSRAGEPV